MTFFSSDAYFYIFWILFVVSYLLRSLPIFKQIWWFYKWTLVILFVILTANYVKKEVKEWWQK
jgi:hypothetical protein